MPNKRSEVLPEKMRRFADIYFVLLKPIESAQEAGYTGSRESLSKQAHRLLSDDRVQAYLQTKRDKLNEETDQTIHTIIQRLKLIANSNIQDFATWDGEAVQFKSSDELSPDLTYAIKRIKGRKRPTFDKEGNKTGDSLEFDLELHSKETALKLLASYYGIDSDWNAIVAGLARFGLVLKEDAGQPSGWRIDRVL